MKVDNTTSGVNDPTFGRPSIKISSNATVSAGSLVLMDAVHMPFGVRRTPQFTVLSTSHLSLVLCLACVLDARRQLA